MSNGTESIGLSRARTPLSILFKHEDYWAIWLGTLILIVGLVAVVFSQPTKLASIVETSNATMAAEEARAPFKTIAWHEANDKKLGQRASSMGPLKELGSYLGRPKGWTTNPIQSFAMSESEAAAKRDAAKARHDAAKEKLTAARAAAEAAEAAAAGAGFANAQLNDAARTAIADWRKARSAESSARGAATAKPYNIVGGLLVLGIGLGVLFSIGTAAMGRSVPKFLVGFAFVYLLAVISYFIAAQADVKGWGLDYVLWAILLGLVISNTVGTPEWVKPAVQVEYYIKTGLVLLGASILVGKIVIIGLPGVFVTWVVTPIVLVVTYWFGQKIVKIDSKTLNIVVSADMCVSGVSAAIATAAACRAKKEELTLAVGISLMFTAIMMFVMPAFIKAVDMHHVLGGAWMGGTIDSTGAVVAAGALLSDTAMYVAATIKMIQNVMIGVIAFAVAAYWAIRVDRAPGDVDLSIGGALREIWNRFPRFILGFLGASIVFSIIYGLLGADVGRALIEQGAIRGWSDGIQRWLFCLAFVSIGLATNFRELAHMFEGGKPIILYLCGQSFNILLTLTVAYVMFFHAFPWVTERLMAG